MAAFRPRCPRRDRGPRDRAVKCEFDGGRVTCYSRYACQRSVAARNTEQWRRDNASMSALYPPPMTVATGIVRRRQLSSTNRSRRAMPCVGKRQFAQLIVVVDVDAGIVEDQVGFPSVE